jgi:hypothetical protein
MDTRDEADAALREVAVAAAADAGGLDPELLGQFLPALATAAASGRGFAAGRGAAVPGTRRTRGARGHGVAGFVEPAPVRGPPAVAAPSRRDCGS